MKKRNNGRSKIEARNWLIDKPDVKNDYYLWLASNYSRDNIHLQNGAVIHRDQLYGLIKFFTIQRYE